MSHRGDAYAIATAIYAGTREAAIVDTDELSDRIYITLVGMGLGADEVKADIYAQLAESLKADTPFETAVLIIEAAIAETRRHA